MNHGGLGNDRPTATMPKEQINATSGRNDGQEDKQKKVSEAWCLEFCRNYGVKPLKNAIL
jgi:hypothetical protein